MDKALIQRMARKHHLNIRHDFSDIWDQLAAVNIHAAEAFRDAIWNKHGKWHGVGVGNIPAQEVIEYALELERMALAGEYLELLEFELLEYKIEN